MVTWSELLETWSWRYLAASYDTMTGAGLGQSRAAIAPPAPRQLTSALSPTLSLSLSTFTMLFITSLLR